MAGVGVSTTDRIRHRQLLLPFTVNCTHAHTSQMNIVLNWGMSRWSDVCFLLMFEMGGLLIS